MTVADNSLQELASSRSHIRMHRKWRETWAHILRCPDEDSIAPDAVTCDAATQCNAYGNASGVNASMCDAVLCDASAAPHVTAAYRIVYVNQSSSSNSVVTLPPGGLRSIVTWCVCSFTCLSVCPRLTARVTRKPHSRTSSIFFMHVACGRGSILLWRRCHILYFRFSGWHQVFTWWL